MTNVTLTRVLALFSLSIVAVACDTGPNSVDVARVRLVEKDALFQSADPHFTAQTMISAVGSSAGSLQSASTVLRNWQIQQAPDAAETLRFGGVVEANMLREGWVLFRLSCDSMNAVYERRFSGGGTGSFIAAANLGITPNEVGISVNVPVGSLTVGGGSITAGTPVSIVTCGLP